MIKTMQVKASAVDLNRESVLDRTVGATMARAMQTAARQDTQLGECLDVGSAERAGQLLVQYENDSGRCLHRWLDCLRGVEVAVGDRVLLLQTRTETSPIVVGALAGPGEQPPARRQPQFVVRKGESLRVTNSAGQDLLEIHSTESGPSIRLVGADVDLQLPGKLRIAAEEIDLQSRAEMRLKAGDDVVVRGTYIRLN